jgi:succinate dehydrogenase flavin-adding protein (antitoxin of CptAB toxin-antitoxin module)
VLAYYLYVIKTTQLRKSEIMTADSDIRLGGSCSAIGTAAHRRFDRIFGRFAESSLAGFDTVQLDRLESLLDCADPDLFEWVSGRIAPPPAYDHDVMLLLRSRIHSVEKG